MNKILLVVSASIIFLIYTNITIASNAGRGGCVSGSTWCDDLSKSPSDPYYGFCDSSCGGICPLSHTADCAAECTSGLVYHGGICKKYYWWDSDGGGWPESCTDSTGTKKDRCSNAFSKQFLTADNTNGCYYQSATACGAKQYCEVNADGLPQCKTAVCTTAADCTAISCKVATCNNPRSPTASCSYSDATDGTSCGTLTCPADFCGASGCTGSGNYFCNYPSSVAQTCTLGSCGPTSCTPSTTNCLAVTSSDSDSGDAPKSPGTVTDTTGCAAASGCTTTARADSCSGGTLTEYCPSSTFCGAANSGYSSTTYTCTSFSGWYCVDANKIENRVYSCVDANPDACGYTDPPDLDCTTELTTDSDGGNNPFTQGIVNDKTSCTGSPGSAGCAVTTYTDTCPTSTTLTEYYPNGASYSSTTYTCDSCSSGVCNDNSVPTGTISINSGAAYTTSTSVTLTLSCSDTGISPSLGCSQMKISDTFAGIATATAESYSTTKTWTLPTGDGAKAVYVIFRDAEGNWMANSAATADTITLDTTNPSGTIWTSPNPVGIFETSTFTITANDNIDISRIEFCDVGVNCNLLGTEFVLSHSCTGVQTSCSKQWSVIDTTAGTNNYRAVIYDSAGRSADASPSPYALTVVPCATTTESIPITLENGCHVTLKSDGWDIDDANNDISWKRDQTVLTPGDPGDITVVMDDALPGGDCDLDLKFKNQWDIGEATDQSKITITSTKIQKDADNELAYGFVLSTSSPCYILQVLDACNVNQFTCPAGPRSLAKSLLQASGGMVRDVASSQTYGFVVGECATDDDCSSPEPFCDTTNYKYICADIKPSLVSPANSATTGRYAILDVTDVTGANSYHFYARTSGQTQATAGYTDCRIGSVDATSALSLNTQYWWSAKACDGDSCIDCGSYASERTFTVGQCDANDLDVDNDGVVDDLDDRSNQCPVVSGKLGRCRLAELGFTTSLYTCEYPACAFNYECGSNNCCGSITAGGPGGTFANTCWSRGTRSTDNSLLCN